MKKIITLMLIIILISLTIAFSVYANQSIKVFLNGDIIEFDQPPIIQGSRTLVQMRSIFEAMGIDVSWYDGTIVATRSNDILYAFIDQNLGILNNKSIYFDVSPTLINNITMVPVRAISQAFGATVTWDSITKTVEISYPKTNILNTEKIHILNENTLKNISIYSVLDDCIGTFNSLSDIGDEDMLTFGIMMLYKTTDLKWEDFEHSNGLALIPKNLLDPIFLRYFGITNYIPNEDLVHDGNYIIYPRGLEYDKFERISQIDTDNKGNTIIKLELLFIDVEEMPQEYIRYYGNETVIDTAAFHQGWIDGKLPQLEPDCVNEMIFNSLGHVVKYVNTKKE